MKQTTSKVPQIRFKGFEGEWEDRQFSDIVSSLSGGASIKPEDYQNYGVRTVPKGAVNSTGIADLAGSKFVSKEFFGRNNTSQVSTGDLVTSLRDLVPSAPNLGRIVKIKGESEDFLMPQGVYKIELRANIDENFVISYSNAGEFRKVISSEKNGSTQVHLRNGEFLGITIFTPTHSEQTKIGEYFQDLDGLIGLHQRKHDKLVTLKKAMLQKMFPQAGATTPEIRFKGFSGLWEEKTLVEVADVYDGTHQTPHYTKVGVMFLSVENIHTLRSAKFISKEAFKSEFKTFPQKGDVLMTRIGDIGTANVVESIEPIAYYVSLALLKPKAVDPYFLKHCISSDSVTKALFHRTLHIAFPKKINKNEIEKVEIRLPESKTEQQKIGTYFRQLDELISKHAIQLQKLKQLKTACLEKMFV